MASIFKPLRFDELVGDGFSPQENPARVVFTDGDDDSTALSGHVMRGGRHFVALAISGGYRSCVDLGVIRPVSLTKCIDLDADWRRSVNPVNISCQPTNLQ